MPGSHTVTQRPTNDAERQALEVRAGAHPRADALFAGFTIVVLCLLPIVLLFSLSMKLSGAMTLRSWLEVALHVLALVACALFVLALVRSRRRYAVQSADSHAQRRAELEAGVVEEIEVRTDRAVLFHPYQGIEIGLAVDAGPSTTLVLYSSALWDETLYDAPEWRQDDAPPDGLHIPFAFPTGRFTVVRTPVTGYLLSIRAQGDFVRPEPAALPSLAIDEHTDARLIDTPLDALRRP